MARPLIDLIRAIEVLLKELKTYAYKDEKRDARLRKVAAKKAK